MKEKKEELGSNQGNRNLKKYDLLTKLNSGSSYRMTTEEIAEITVKIKKYKICLKIHMVTRFYLKLRLLGDLAHLYHLSPWKSKF